MMSKAQYRGLQDAARKRRIDNGPWAGCLLETSNQFITITVPQNKWDKAKCYVSDLYEKLEDPNVLLEHKHLERVCGFLCHMAMTFRVICCYLKGFHLTLYQHLPKRNEYGWKMTDMEWLGHLRYNMDKNNSTME